MTTTIAASLEAQIKDLICTSRPYYALQNLHALTDKLLQCEINTENFQFGEIAPISAAETGRHLAILGSCALAYVNPVECKHYYLACQAELRRCIDPLQLAKVPVGEGRLICRAQVEHLDNKTGSVSTSISTLDGTIIYELDVAYKVMKADLFHKLFRNKYNPTSNSSTANPYTKNIPIQNLVYNINTVSGELGAIKPENCVGHFEDYPALPIAILSSAFVDMSSKHLKYILNNEDLRYTIKCTKLKASKLAFTGEEVFLKSALIYTCKNEMTFKVNATNQLQQDLGEVIITFEVAC
jgi:hypothetical protein